MLTVVGHSRLALVTEGVDAEGNMVNPAGATPDDIPAATSTLKAALEVTPNPTTESWMRAIAKRLAATCAKQVRC